LLKQLSNVVLSSSCFNPNFRFEIQVQFEVVANQKLRKMKISILIIIIFGFFVLIDSVRNVTRLRPDVSLQQKIISYLPLKINLSNFRAQKYQKSNAASAEKLALNTNAS
jgi:cell division protein FtsB